MININLLPPETILAAKEGSRYASITRFSIAIFTLLIVLTSAVLTVRFLQNVSYQRSTKALADAETRVVSLRDKESLPLILKSRLSSIQNLNMDPKRNSLFSLINSLISPLIGLNSLSLDRSGKVVIGGFTSSRESLESLISDLFDKQKNSDLVNAVSLDSLSVGKDGILRFTLKIDPK